MSGESGSRGAGSLLARPRSGPHVPASFSQSGGALKSRPGHPTSVPVPWEGGLGQLPVPLKGLGQVSVLASLPHPSLGLALGPRPVLLALSSTSQSPVKTPPRAQRLGPPRHLVAGREGACQKGKGGESQRRDLALCPCRSGARFYYNPYILLQILYQLVPRLGWTLW